ncbi:metal ABC transporter solute-binding protein, Zn/Mn family [Alkaliphilus metalliredigens]|nr:zinc ABC transporter substrate-binding protein [Alkaliphilus metalliredigens]
MMFTLLAVVVAGCSPSSQDDSNDKYQVVATRTMLADLVSVIGGEYVTVTGLMGPGIDPHLYNASAGDVNTIQSADLLVYNGLQLESKLGEVFQRMKSQKIPNANYIIEENNIIKLTEQGRAYAIQSYEEIIADF